MDLGHQRFFSLRKPDQFLQRRARNIPQHSPTLTRKIDNERHRGVINLGVRPTISGNKSERVLEVHLFDFSRDIYGRDVEVRFLKFLRSEKKFESVDALVAQIRADVEEARELFRT